MDWNITYCVTGLAQYLLRVTGLAHYCVTGFAHYCVTGLALYVLCDWIGTLLCVTGLVVIVCDYRHCHWIGSHCDYWHCVTGLVVIVTIGTVSLDWSSL